jgi:hypothetical protein
MMRFGVAFIILRKLVSRMLRGKRSSPAPVKMLGCEKRLRVRAESIELRVELLKADIQ